MSEQIQREIDSHKQTNQILNSKLVAHQQFINTCLEDLINTKSNLHLCIEQNRDAMQSFLSKDALIKNLNDKISQLENEKESLSKQLNDLINDSCIESNNEADAA